jgi:renalase
MATPYALPMNPPEVAVGSSLRRAVVIGAGPAGLSAASRLALAGVDVTVLEKSRGIGGRVATRRTRDGLAFDHGAQFVTARGTSFGAFLQGASEIGCASEWNPITDPSRFHVATGSTDTASSGPASQWFVGTPGMSSLFKNLAAGLTIRTEVTVTRVDLTEHEVWVDAIESEHGPHRSGPFDAAIIAIPAAQASAVAGHLDGVAASLARVVITPCWALMLAFSGDLQMPSDVFRRSEGPIAWVARNTSKPGRAPEVTTLVIHASPEWTRGLEGHCPIRNTPSPTGGGTPRPRYPLPRRFSKRSMGGCSSGVTGRPEPESKRLGRVAKRWRCACFPSKPNSCAIGLTLKVRQDATHEHTVKDVVPDLKRPHAKAMPTEQSVAQRGSCSEPHPGNKSDDKSIYDPE